MKYPYCKFSTWITNIVVKQLWIFDHFYLKFCFDSHQCILQWIFSHWLLYPHDDNMYLCLSFRLPSVSPVSSHYLSICPYCLASIEFIGHLHFLVFPIFFEREESFWKREAKAYNKAQCNCLINYVIMEYSTFSFAY